MPTRVSRRRRLKKYSIGDMRERITIYTRSITPPAFGSISFTETYNAGTEYWSSIETMDNKFELFGGVNIPPSTTHKFIIRFDSSITTENIIGYNSEYYKILKVSNPDSRKQYLELYSKLAGDDTLEANT